MWVGSFSKRYVSYPTSRWLGPLLTKEKKKKTMDFIETTQYNAPSESSSMSESGAARWSRIDNFSVADGD